MAELVESKATRHEFSVAYTGATRADEHSIDVQVLAPALLAFGKLLREANAEINGKKATAKVLVVSDFEHKCFNINFELILSAYEQVKSFFGKDEVQSAKNILECVGILSAAGYSLFKYLKWRSGRKIQEVKQLVDTDQTGMVAVRVEGEHNSIEVHNHVYALSENPRALRAARDSLLPLGDDGFDKMEFKDGNRVVGKITERDVESIVASCNVGIEESKEPQSDVEVTPAWLSVYSPVYDLAAPNWRFRLGKEVIYADISETKIAQQALERGGAFVDDTYQVRLEVITEVDAQGKKKPPKYKVLEVIRFVPARPLGKQTSLFKDEGSD